jgi:hypothetical protein
MTKKLEPFFHYLNAMNKYGMDRVVIKKFIITQHTN